jgi:hypothetical protein
VCLESGNREVEKVAYGEVVDRGIGGSVDQGMFRNRGIEGIGNGEELGRGNEESRKPGIEESGK